MKQSSSQGRYFLLDGPVSSPGCCAICGYSSRERSYLDPRLDFEFYGSVIFCEICVGSMAQMFGLLTHERVADLEQRLETAERELIQLRAVVAAGEALDVAVRAYSSGGHLSSDPGLQSWNSSDDVSRSDTVDEGASEELPSGESSFDVSGISQGPDDVFSLGDSNSTSLDL